MKKFLIFVLALLMLFSVAACGETADTSLVTDSTTTDAPVGDGTSSADDEIDSNVIFEYDFSDTVEEKEDFTLSYNMLSSFGNYLAPSDYTNGALLINDNEVKLDGKNFMVEADITFYSFPYKTEEVTNFPLSVISWIRESEGNTTYDWAFRLDERGYVYVENQPTPTSVKIEAGKRYTFGVCYYEDEATLEVLIDGETVSMKGYAPKELDSSAIRILDYGNDKARYSAHLHATRAYYVD